MRREPVMIATDNKVKLVPVGEGLGVPFSPEMLARLGVKAGDSVVLTATDDTIAIRRLTEHELQMQIAEKIMAERHELLRRLSE